MTNVTEQIQTSNDIILSQVRPAVSAAIHRCKELGLKRNMMAPWSFGIPK